MLPMTVIVLAVLAACFLAGVILIGRSLAQRRGGARQSCLRCGTKNPPLARFCAQCGAKLDAATGM